MLQQPMRRVVDGASLFDAAVDDGCVQTSSRCALMVASGCLLLGETDRPKAEGIDGLKCRDEESKAHAVPGILWAKQPPQLGGFGRREGLPDQSQGGV